MSKVSRGYNQSILAIKQWLTRFGLSSDGGPCEVPLDIEIDLEPEVAKVDQQSDQEEAKPEKPVDPWTKKESVCSAVFSKVDRIRAFR